MNLTLSFIFAALLVLIGAPRSLLNDNADKVGACGQASGTLAFAEAMETWSDDRLTGSLSLASAVTTPHSYPIRNSVICQSSPELNSIKENFRIYKLNYIYLI